LTSMRIKSKDSSRSQNILEKLIPRPISRLRDVLNYRNLSRKGSRTPNGEVEMATTVVAIEVMEITLTTDKLALVEVLTITTDQTLEATTTMALKVIIIQDRTARIGVTTNTTRRTTMVKATM
jgi:hypothetical protein